jgi:hypothetical protein
VDSEGSIVEENAQLLSVKCFIEDCSTNHINKLQENVFFTPFLEGVAEKGGGKSEK